ncbi:hypothetical protein F3Y22_tig00111366pilonHSYRG00264 [Hibiscus syriacus]|uniref:Amidase domain-containing protein n=1 Tax=Hibiscus syriacus TaxID=106335 RepID=A0A6A2YNI8_HIBSY|nr:hypothetical protein F3Y22_tig00111366pilonHSYRG00264 [Hibiscus syriacus]
MVSLSFTIKEATVEDFQLDFKSKSLTSRQLVEFYRDEILRLNQSLKAVIEASHSVPCAWNPYSAQGQHCNKGSNEHHAKLRQAGAIILGKASLTEWANFRGNTMPDGWCARSGQGKNPYSTEGGTCGSSSGPAISAAANLAAVTLGTETDGSILCPLAIRPSSVSELPLVSPAEQESSPLLPDRTPPICRTVADTVYVLDAIVGEDLNDEATIEASKYIPKGGYKQFLKIDGLKRNRLALLGDLFLDDQNTTGIGEKKKDAIQKLANMSRDGFEKLMTENNLDALLLPFSYGSSILATGQHPGIIVPAGYDTEGLPFGLSFGGLKGSEPTLIQIAYDFEQATKIRRPPTFTHSSY